MTGWLRATSAAPRKPFAHAIVDEAQDLHPAQWRLLRHAVAAGPNDLFIAGDAHQRIYDHHISLLSLGIDTRGKSRRLKISYRTSQQVLGWALGILTGQPIEFEELGSPGRIDRGGRPGLATEEQAELFELRREVTRLRIERELP